MSMRASEVREKYLKFFEKKGHTIIDPAPLVLENDPTTLFTSSGMQPLVPYLMGDKHPMGKRLVDSQPSIRTIDIDEVGDNRHHTFFEMLGNWSLGDYFKKDQLNWIFEFCTKELGLDKNRLWVTVFEGNKDVPKDEESVEIWKKIGIPESRIFYYPAKKNWWSRSGTPDKMPVGEIGGPDSELFYEFTNVKHNPEFGKECHPNCDCGRFVEIGNSVFMQYKKVGEDKLEELPQKNVDFGGGFERLVATVNSEQDDYKTDLFIGIINKIERITGRKYSESKNVKPMRVIADHIKAAVFLIANGIEPSNKQHGYVLRRLLRRAAVKFHELGLSLYENTDMLVDEVFGIYRQDLLKENDEKKVKEVISTEVAKFVGTLSKGSKLIEKLDIVDAKTAFDLYQTYGFPLEITKEILEERGQKINEDVFRSEFEKHQEKSRTTSAGVFKGGLADHSDEVVRLHTATHLLLATLRKLVGEHVVQKGQNITKERSRFDFPNPEKLSDEKLKEVENMINEVIEKDLPVSFEVMPKDVALKTGAIHAFNEKYADTVKVYFVGKDLKSAYSKEFCGGPHVTSTAQIGRVRIKKQEKIGSGLIRIYLEVGSS